MHDNMPKINGNPSKFFSGYVPISGSEQHK